MNKRLKLAILAQALIDAIDEGDEEDIETALAYLSSYPRLLNRINQNDKQDLAKWKRCVERAMGRPPARRN